LKWKSYLHNFDSLNITQSDSSIVRIEMSPDLAAAANRLSTPHLQMGPISGAYRLFQHSGCRSIRRTNRFYSWQTMFVKSLEANLTGPSLLDVGRAHPVL
jgi:hypothetical protein